MEVRTLESDHPTYIYECNTPCVFLLFFFFFFSFYLSVHGGKKVTMLSFRELIITWIWGNSTPRSLSLHMCEMEIDSY